jgi:sec-independent protein translocase protein TatB
MPGFGDSAFIILLALLLFGPKKLPVLARQLGKLMGDFRRASNEFRTQMEEELRISEQAERQKQIAALEASAPPPTAALDSPATDAHTPPEPPAFATPDSPTENLTDTPAEPSAVGENSIAPPAGQAAEPASSDPAPAPLPIATSGDLAMMPPSTGLPVPKTPPAPDNGVAHETELETETLHG